MFLISGISGKAAALAFLTVLLSPHASFASTTCEERPSDCEQLRTRSSLKAALIHDLANPANYSVLSSAAGERSIPLAFAMSAVLPGAGQAYNRHWTKAVVGVVLEAAAIALWSSSKSRGNDAEDDFVAFAHRYWEPDKYASWINDYTDFLEASHGAAIGASAVNVVTGVDFQNPDAWSSQDRAAVLQMFAQIQNVERELFHPETGATFSHRLPNFGEQQYYELIGKYFQFAPGWNDYPEWKDGLGNFTEAIDPERSGPGNTKPNVSATFFKYADDHAHAQDLLRQASRISLIIVANHVIAAVDAAVSAKLHNDRISTSMGIERAVSGDFVPVARLRYRL